IDYASRVFSITGLSVPGFWLGTLIITLPAIYFQWVPPLRYRFLWENPSANLQQMLPPALALGFSLSAIVARMTRSMMLEVLRQDYIRTAWAKGLRERVVIVRHALKNAMIPVVTITGNQFGFLLGGSVVMEQVFSLPGVGRLLVESIG